MGDPHSLKEAGRQMVPGAIPFGGGMVGALAVLNDDFFNLFRQSK